MAAADQKPEFTRIALKYKSLDVFAKAARTTFAKGRMTLKSKKELDEGQRIILAVGLPEREKPVEIICEIQQKVKAEKDGASNTYGVRWLNFTEKKLSKLIDGDKVAEKPKKRAKPVEPEKPKPPEKTEDSPPAPVTEPEPISESDRLEEATPPKDSDEKKKLSVEADEEYIIPKDEGVTYPSFEDKPEVLVPSPPEEEKPKDNKEGKEMQAGNEADEEYTINGDQGEAHPSFEDSPEVTASPAHDNYRAEAPAPDDVEVDESQQQKKDEKPAATEMKPPPPPPPPQPPPPPAYDMGEPDILSGESPALDKEIEAPPEELDELMAITSREEPPLEEDDSAIGAITVDDMGPITEDLPGPEDEPAEEREEAPTQYGKPITSEEVVALGAFMLRLIRLMLKPDKVFGPEGDKNLKALYEEFKTVMSGRDEVTIYVRSAGAVREFMLTGDVQVPVNLKTKMPSDQFDEMAMKVVDLFGSKKLVGIQFRRYLTEDAFRGFVARMGRYNPSKETPEDLAAGLLREGVFHVTPLHESDRVKVAKAVDFRVDMTLARLSGDIKRLNLIAEAIGEDPAALWTLRVEDTMKGIQDGPLRAEVLLNADKVVKGQEEITESDLLQEIILATHVEMLSDAADYMGQRYSELYAKSEAEKSGEIEAEMDHMRQVLRQVTARLTVDLPKAAARIMGGLYRKGVFTLDELPPQLRQQVMLEQFIDFFLTDPEQRLADFGNIKTKKDYKIAADRYARMVAELVKRGELDAAENIFQTLVQHIKSKDSALPERPQLAREAFVHLADPESLKSLAESLAVAQKDKRDRLAAMIFASGAASAGPLIDLLATVEDRSLRRVICEILTRLGEQVAPILVERAKDQTSPWYLVRNLIMILGDMKNQTLRQDIELFAGHEHPRVREEALAYAAKIIGMDSEPLLVSALSDSDPLVRRKAAWVLNKFPQLGDSVLVAVVDMIQTKQQKKPTPEEEQAIIAASELTGRLGGRTLPDGSTVEDVLINVLEPDTSRGLLSRIAGSKSNRTPKMLAALIETLGKTGTEKCKKLLETFAKDKDTTIKESARAALAAVSGGA